MGQVWQIATAHEADLCEGLDDTEYEHLATLLNRTAEQQQLTPGVHPGYRRMPPAE
ncbi:hypothetical protein [Nocardia sp. CA-135398]|uniref:hypothetical protein n=1 Tax=Nocardia sp. CA-135398 TaxID=3239977 RepID=UPI003D96A39B